MVEYPFKDLLPIDEVLEREGYYKDWTHLDPKVFYSLTQISEYIKTKGYGVDVRLLIAQLAEHFSLKTAQINQIELFFKDVMQELAEDKDFHSLPEIAGARGGFDTLGERLNDTDAQLAQKVGGGKLATANDLDEGLLNFISDGVGGPISVESIPKNKSVTPKKTTFYDISKNLVDTRNVVKRTYLGGDGELYERNTRDTTDFFEVEVGVPHTLTNVWRYALYDKNKVFQEVGATENAETTITPDYPLMRVTYDSINAERVQVELGTVATPFSPFYSKVKEVENQLILNTDDASLTDFDYISAYVNPTTGEITLNTAGNMVSKLIELKKGETLNVSVHSFQSSVSVLSKWDFDGSTATFKSSLMTGNFDNPDIEISYTATDDVEYLRLGGVDDAELKLNTLQIIEATCGGEVYDQSLNTTDDVIFHSLKTTGVIPTGTLSSPPAGLLVGDMWADTADSTSNPMVRVKLQ